MKNTEDIKVWAKILKLEYDCSIILYREWGDHTEETLGTIDRLTKNEANYIYSKINSKEKI